MSTHIDTPRTTRPATLVEEDVVTTVTGRRWLAVTRLAAGFIFFWAFVDKLFGLGYSTPTERAWINGGTPSQGFMKSDAVVGPFKDTFAGLASPVTDWLFMLALLGIGVALLLGIGLRIAAVAGSLLMLLMWTAEWHLQSGSTNPLVEYHVIYALVLIVSAVLLAGDTWGLGRRWARLPLVQKAAWLR
ncbi:DoxX family membrane protein [Cellulomonas fimi]|uniref:DoxX family membrane protein n=1 Tax=Cellulomonas fimi TaxID=1708 RepID=A0A7Y0M0T3_CELFI|nr:DoxX family membrane protein [Cellulomonas fimi]NMR21670.1 DoxX family membrane protein [Cellulomonas fimi]